MKHGLEQLTKRMRFNREHNISFDGEDLMSEAEDIELYGSKAFAAVWCDPEDNFVKDYHVINTDDDNDTEEQAAIDADKAEFSKDRNTNDIYIITLLELMDALEYQDRIL